MENNKKYFTLLIVVLSILLLATACSPGRTQPRTQPRSYNLNLEVVGEGVIRDSDGQFITTSERTLSIDSDSIMKIEAEPSIDSDFFFWTGDIADNIINPEQSINMNRNKEVIAVFGNPNEVFMAGYLTESWGTTDIIGYWKALTETPGLEIYLRRTIGSKEAYRYIFDEGDPEQGRIVYHQPDLPNSKYIAAIIRIEESDLLEFEEELKYLFVYIDRRGFTALVEEYSPAIDSIYEDLIDRDKYSQQEFLDEVNRLIHENRHEDIIIGNTVRIIGHDF